MERDEAAGSGLALLDPATLGLEELRRRFPSSGTLSGEVWLQALDHLGLAPGVLAIAGRVAADEILHALERLEGRGWTPVGVDARVLAARKAKTAWELDEIRRVASGTCEAFRRVAAILCGAVDQAGELRYADEPLTAGVLRREIALALAARGLGQPEGNIVAAGYDAAVPHSQGPSERVLHVGEALVVDLYPKGHLFADCTRTFCVGSPPQALARAHAEVVRALESAEAAAGVGVSGRTLQDLVCESFEQAGYETARSRSGLTSGYVHSLGHGVGLDLHELPSFRADGEEGLLAPGDAITLEPGLYDPEQGWGVRVENLYLVEQQGLENLTPLPCSLDPRDW